MRYSRDGAELLVTSVSAASKSPSIPIVQDSSSGAAYVARPGGPPDTAAYMWAGYAVALAFYLGWILLMARRIGRLYRSREL